jgi:hypothetical protein
VIVGRTDDNSLGTMAPRAAKTLSDSQGTVTSRRGGKMRKGHFHHTLFGAQL